MTRCGACGDDLPEPPEHVIVRSPGESVVPICDACRTRLIEVGVLVPTEPPE